MDTKIRTIIEEVCQLYNVSIDDVPNKTRRSVLVYPRQMIFHFVKKYVSDITFHEVGNIWKDTHDISYDHATVIYACNKVLSDAKYDKYIRESYEYLDQMFNMLFNDVGDSYGIKKSLFTKLMSTHGLNDLYDVLDEYKDLVGNMNEVDVQLKEKIKTGCIRLTQ